MTYQIRNNLRLIPNHTDETARQVTASLFFYVLGADICRYIALMYILYGRNEKAEKIIEEVKHGRIVD